MDFPKNRASDTSAPRQYGFFPTDFRFRNENPKQLAVLRRAISDADSETIERTAHCLKSELGYLEMPRATQLARELEEIGRSGRLEQAPWRLAALEAEIAGVDTEMKGLKTHAGGKVELG